MGVDGQPERAIGLTRIGSGVYGAATVTATRSVRLRLEAGEPPKEIVIRTHARSYPSERWRRVLPDCLGRRGGPASEAGGRDFEVFAQDCAKKPLSANMAQVAEDFLSGPSKDASLRVAVLLLRHLATHPLDRSAALGALAAALCQKEVRYDTNPP